MTYFDTMKGLLSRLAFLEPLLPKHEADFRKASYRTDVRRISVLLLALGALSALWIYKDATMSIDRLPVWPLQAMRVFTMCIAAVFFWRQRRRSDQVLESATLYAIAAVIVLHQLATLVSRPLSYSYTSYTSIVLVFILYFMFPFGLVTRAAFALTLSVGEIVFVLLFKEYEPGGKFTLVIAHLFANLLGAFWSAGANTIKRKSYLDFIVLKKAKARIDFMYRVLSHDVRAPFSALISQSGLLKQSLDAGDYSKSQDLAASMGAMIQQSYLMTENLLEWGGRESKQARAKQIHVDLVELVSDTVALFRPLLEQKGLHLEMRLERRVTLKLDARSFQVIIRNIVHNACKFSADGSELRLSLTRGAELISIELFNQGKPISRRVVKKIERIDEWYSSYVGQRHSGAGLGLGISFDIARRNSWTLSLEPILSSEAAGTGTLARLAIPIAITHAEARPSP